MYIYIVFMRGRKRDRERKTETESQREEGEEGSKRRWEVRERVAREIISIRSDVYYRNKKKLGQEVRIRFIRKRKVQGSSVRSQESKKEKQIKKVRMRSR